MGKYDFNYEMPEDFDGRMQQLLQQLYRNDDLADAFRRCKHEHNDLGLAYYAGMRGDNWNQNALDFTIEGSKRDIETLKANKSIVEKAIGMALKPSSSGYLLRECVYLVAEDVATTPASNEERLNADLATAEAVLSDILMAGERLSANASYTSSSSEDSMNDYLRDMLSAKGYNEAKDQTRHGLSANGQNAGEVDLLLSKDGKEIAVIEGMKLGYVDTGYIDAHIDKAIKSYNPLGTATFIVAYVHSADFGAFWDRYTAHLMQYDFAVEVKRAISTRAYPNAVTRVASAVLSRDGYDFPIYFIAFRLLR